MFGHSPGTGGLNEHSGHGGPRLSAAALASPAVYQVLVEGQPALVLRPLDALEATVLYQGASEGPFFSPDGAWVGFYSADGTIKRVAVTGGPALTIGDAGDPGRSSSAAG